MPFLLLLKITFVRVGIAFLFLFLSFVVNETNAERHQSIERVTGTVITHGLSLLTSELTISRSSDDDETHRFSSRFYYTLVIVKVLRTVVVVAEATLQFSC